MSSFRDDYRWQFQYLDPMRRIIGPLLLEPAPFEIDANEATDLMVLRARDMRVGCRVRRPGYADRYPFEFTIRSSRDSGAKTELQKIVEGWCDWFFYGHVASDKILEFCRWFVIDLSAWRAHMIRGNARPVKKSNGDGTHFVAFDVRAFPTDPPILVASCP